MTSVREDCARRSLGLRRSKAIIFAACISLSSAASATSCSSWYSLVKDAAGGFSTYIAGGQEYAEINWGQDSWRDCAVQAAEEPFVSCTHRDSGDASARAKSLASELEQCFPDARFYRPVSTDPAWGSTQNMRLIGAIEIIVHWAEADQPDRLYFELFKRAK